MESGATAIDDDATFLFFTIVDNVWQLPQQQETVVIGDGKGERMFVIQ